MSSEKENKSCFTLDGVVAEMDIEVEDSHGHGFEVLGDTSEKNSNIKKDTSDSNVQKPNEEETLTEDDINRTQTDSEILDSSLEIIESKKSDSESNKNLSEKRKRDSSIDDTKDEKDIQDQRYPGRKRHANKKYISDELVSGPIISRSNSLQSTNSSSKDGKKRKIEVDSQDAVSDEGKFPWRKNKDAPDIPDLKPKVLWWNGVGEGQGEKLGNISGIRERIKSSRSVRPLFRVLYFQWPTNGIDLIGQILKFNGFPFDKTSYEFTKRQSMMKIMLDVTISHIAEILGLKVGPKKTMINDILNFLLKPYGKTDPYNDPTMQPVVMLEQIVLDSKFLAQAMDYYKIKKEIPNPKSLQPKEKLALETHVRSPRLASVKKNDVEESVTSRRKTGTKPGFKNRSSSSSKSLKPSGKGDISKGLKDEKPQVSEKSKCAEKGKTKVKGKSQDKPKAREKSKPSVKPKEEKTKSTEKLKLPEKSKVQEKSTPKVQEKAKTSEKQFTVEAKIVNKSEMKKYDDEEFVDVSLSEISSSSSDSEIDISEMKKKIKLLKKKIQRKKSLKKIKSKEEYLDAKNEKKNIVEIEIDIEEKKGDEPEKKKKSKQHKILSMALDSSETESSDEAKLASVNLSRKNIKKTRLGKPLKNFPKIVESIQKASFSALQRLHILLFGASDKAENLKSNILAFGGFPFLEGSDEWKQKHFLLSLLAQNNLKEYLNLMCIESSDEDQTAMINKLMKFLAAPTENPGADVSSPPPPVIETEVISSELVNQSPKSVAVKNKTAGSNKNRGKKIKKETMKKGPRNRKVLMSEEEAKKMEASFAREQRALARDDKNVPFSKTPSNNDSAPPTMNSEVVKSVKPIKPKPSILDPVNPSQLHALLQTVYKRRALKEAGAVISTPNKGQKTKLGEIENIKFLVVTSNLRDLELLHRLIFMLDSSKSRVRKNILDFSGFNFTEESSKYKERMDFLNELGYDVSKRLSFLLGLCPLHTNIPQQDLNELIMYFLMSPAKTKEVVPITQMPTDSGYVATVEKTPTPAPQNIRQKAKKSISSTLASPVKKVMLPPFSSPHLPSSMKLIGAFPVRRTDATNLPSSQAYSTSTPKPVLITENKVAPVTSPKMSGGHPLLKLPVANPGMNLQVINSGSNVAVLDTPKRDHSILPKLVSQRQVPLDKKSFLKNQAITSTEEFIVQQQTPDGKQKTFKLIRLPPNHPLASVVKPSVQNSASPTPVVLQNKLPLVNTTVPAGLPPGIIIVKNAPPMLGVQNLAQKINVPTTKVVDAVSSLVQSEEFVLPDEGQSANTNFNDPEIEILNPMEENPPTDHELFSSIQEIILSSNFEDITLRNVIERVSAQFPCHDLTPRHNFMKECVKKIIIGTS